MPCGSDGAMLVDMITDEQRCEVCVSWMKVEEAS